MLAPAVILTAGACFATRNDVRVLQGDIARLQDHALRQERADSLHAAQLRQVVQALTAVGDSLKRATATLQRFQGDVSMSMHGVEQQLLTIQELTGQSRKQVDALRAQMEARAADAPPAAAPTPVVPPAAGATTSPAAPPAPGPYQLMELGKQQLARGASSAARAAFNDLLSQYPASDLASEAQYQVALSFASAGSAVEADSVFALVADRYPASDRAPEAIYKRAVALMVAGQTRSARTLFQQVIDKYPKSEAATLSAAMIRTLK